MAAGSVGSAGSVAGRPDLVGGALDLVAQANCSAADLTRRAAAEEETVVSVAAGGDGNGGQGSHTVRGAQEGEDLCVLG